MLRKFSLQLLGAANTFAAVKLQHNGQLFNKKIPTNLEGVYICNYVMLHQKYFEKQFGKMGKHGAL